VTSPIYPIIPMICLVHPSATQYQNPRFLILGLLGLACPDGGSLVDDDVSVVLDGHDAGAVALGVGRVGVPGSFATGVTVGEGLCQCFLSLSLTVNGTDKGDVLHAKVTVVLHNDALHVVLLVGRVLPLALPAPVDGDLAVFLHLELDAAVTAPEALALEQPLAVSEGVVSRRHGEILIVR